MNEIEPTKNPQMTTVAGESLPAGDPAPEQVHDAEVIGPDDLPESEPELSWRAHAFRAMEGFAIALAAAVVVALALAWLWALSTVGAPWWVSLFPVAFLAGAAGRAAPHREAAAARVRAWHVDRLRAFEG